MPNAVGNKLNISRTFVKCRGIPIYVCMCACVSVHIYLSRRRTQNFIIFTK